MNWIKCSERMPEVDVPIIVVGLRYGDIEIGVHPAIYSLYTCTINGKNPTMKFIFDCLGEHDYEINKVTHWIPIPEVPK